MSTETLPLTNDLRAYLLASSSREPEVLRRLREETAAMPEARFQIAPEQGQLMGLLAKIAGVKRGVEVGTFTGYSATIVAMAMPDDGELICCDTSVPFTDVARRVWQEAGVAHKIRLEIGPALATLDRLLAEGQGSSFDYAFIDADKANYPLYHERCVHLVRPGGLILFDNVLWSGAVIDPHADDADTAAIRALNARLRDDPRVDLAMIPIGDGLTVCRRR